MKRWLFVVLLWVFVSCDKHDTLPEWSWDLSFEEIEQYAAAQGRIDDAQLLTALTSSVFNSNTYNRHVDGVWEYQNKPMFGAVFEWQFLFEPDSRCIQGSTSDCPSFKNTVVFVWTYDADRKTIVLRDDSGTIASEWKVIWFSAGRMIVRVFYPEPLWYEKGGDGGKMHAVDMQYYVGDLTSMTCEEFRNRFEINPKN